MNKNTLVQNQAARKGKYLTGKVVASHTLKTITVAVVSSHRHPLYNKAVKTTKRFSVHNETEGIAVGDTVKIQEIKPISKTKHFIVTGKII
jgi:small subunit ribosomal protein S17